MFDKQSGFLSVGPATDGINRNEELIDPIGWKVSGNANDATTEPSSLKLDGGINEYPLGQELRIGESLYKLGYAVNTISAGHLVESRTSQAEYAPGRASPGSAGTLSAEVASDASLGGKVGNTTIELFVNLESDNILGSPASAADGSTLAGQPLPANWYAGGYLYIC